MRLWLTFSAIGVMLIAAGCDTKPKANYGRLGLVEAGGHITLDGRPLKGAVVSFDDLSDDTFSYGLTDANGDFKLQFDSVMTGVKPGTKVVRISTSRRILGLNSSEEGAVDRTSNSRKEPEQVPAEFNKNSKLIVEVVRDKTRFNLDLKSK
jgi:hypothetical protein